MASDSSGQNGRTLTPIRIVVGSDNAGHDYKEAIKKVLKSHVGVAEVLDVGVHDTSDSTAYPHPAVDACKKIKAGEVRTTLSVSTLTAAPARPTSYAIQLSCSPRRHTASLSLIYSLCAGRSSPTCLRHRSRRGHLSKQSRWHSRRDRSRSVFHRACCPQQQRSSSLLRSTCHRVGAGQEIGK